MRQSIDYILINHWKLSHPEALDQTLKVRTPQVTPKYNSSLPIHGLDTQIAYLGIEIRRLAAIREIPIYKKVSE